ncbi:ABC transporter, putative [Coccidioides posadasii C735 delta SOWgp]|uniref:ABC transporter, putative n=1 Tax=Coccidioides posadasii (strain C735) TaxID=222929 RepID=C5P5D1_COCP7|nr:ABC transporter, putative [Coccidioides posadasii C735 delta SOWgp]EER27921.1 ABC transporter, putative [Coccidioides posadasii C735 delta SOWgp]|eukprot:XP_003070066.1 ABC transporter, putative [Coccidioides posadasii C735 delta SOWgp]
MAPETPNRGSKTGPRGCVTQSRDEALPEKSSVIEPRKWRFLPTKKGMNQTFGYFRLLFSSQPKKLDVCLIIIGTLAAIGAGIPFPLLGILFGELVDDLNASTCDNQRESPQQLQSGINTKVLQVIYVSIGNFVCMYIHTGCWSLVGERLVRRLRTRYFRSLLKQEAAYMDKLPSGDVTSRLVSDIEIIQAGTSEKVGLFIGTISYCVAAFIVAFLKVPVIAAMLLSVIPVYFLMAFGGGHYLKKYTKRINVHVDAATSIASSSLSHMGLVHAFNANTRLELLFSQHLFKARLDALKKAVTHASQVGLLYFVAYASNALAFWKGSRLIADLADGKNTNVSVGAVYTVIFVLLDASFILSQMAPFLHIFAAAASAASCLMETIERQSEIDGTSSDGVRTVSFSSDEIEFRDVKFSYPARPDVPVLQGVSFKIPPNKHTAIVGPSGSGKSTTVALIERFYDPCDGDVLIGGINLREINVRYLRGHIGLVQQEPSLLDRSILENIAHGLVSSSAEKHQHLIPKLLDSSLPRFAERIQGGASEHEAIAELGNEVGEIMILARKAATAANALEFIEALPHGFATKVGSTGGQLSGGQKQRIALARALVREPPLLLLDEATAALDSTSEQLIQAALSRISQSVTTVSIAHRLATAKDADNIVVVQHGRVVEQGTHMELVAQGGVYAGMVRLQNLNKFSAASSILSDFSQEFSNEPTLTVDEIANEKRDLEKGFADADGEDTKSPEKSNTVELKKGPKRRLFSTIKGCIPLIRPNLLHIALGLITSLVIGGSHSGEAVLFGHTVGSLNPCKGASSVRSSGELFGLLFFILALVELSATLINGSAFGWAAEKILYRARILSLRSLLSQPLSWHNSEGRTPRTLIAHVTSDATSLSNLTGTTIGILFSILANLISGIILSHIIAWKIAIVLLATIPVLLASGVLRLRILAQYQKRHQKAFAQATAITVEAVDNIRTVSAFCLEQEAYEVFKRALRAPYEATLKTVAHGNFWLSLAYSISNLVYALAYWWGGQQILSGTYSQTQFFIVLPALLFSAQSSGQMFALAPDVSKARIAAENIVGLLTTDPEEGRSGHNSNNAYEITGIFADENPSDVEGQLTTTSSKRSPQNESGMGVQFRDVHFSYPTRPDQIALDGLNLNILPGQFCALVGPSGSGKSTTFAVLEKFYNPTSGSVIVDGIDITKQRGTSFRDSIALVPQENVLFEGTVAFNIGLGARPGHEATQDEIEEACRLANIHETIMALPNGYQTTCSQEGKQFSGGQRQRLSIARALVRKPRLLLLDESTSALDVESEKQVQDSLAKIARRTTIVAIAHRLNTIHRADRIFFIEDGKCVEQGTHAELLERSSKYRANVIHQSLDT